MDFRQTTQAGGRPAPAPTSVIAPDSSKTSPSPSDGSKKPKTPTELGAIGKWTKILGVVILFGVAILVAALAVGFSHVGNSNESKYINTGKYQAVFLNNGQVYFGKIQSMNTQYLNLTSVYYLTQASATGTSSTSSDSNYTLVKLGCQQIHDPIDQMLINRSQVTFWENLQDSGKVATSIKSFMKQNPNGPDCSKVSSQTQASDTSATQGTPTGTGTTTAPKQ